MKRKTNHVIFTKGIIASGKSTWAEKFVEENQDFKRVNRDSIRKMLSNYTYDKANEEIVTNIERDIILSLCNQGYNIIIDNQNLDDKYIKNYTSYIKDICYNDIHFEVKEFPITLTEAIERDSKREFPIGKKAIIDTWKRNEIQLKQMIERHKPKYEFNIKLNSCIICDIDGTLSNSSNRRIFDYKECVNDEVIIPVRGILQVFTQIKTPIVLLSGREEVCRKETEKWLYDNNIPYSFLYMRKEKDFRSDVIVKQELFDEHIRGKYNVAFVIDDRPKVLEMWCKMGLFALNVNQDPLCKNNF